MENLDSLNIIKTIIKKRNAFIAVVFCAAAISYAASFLIKEKFKSNSIVFPVNLYQSSEESSSEQLLQYFLSEDVKYKLAKDFKLFERYGVDTVKSKGGRALFDYMFSENFKMSPTIYESIDIDVKDEDPYFAQKLNTALVKATNELIRRRKTDIVNQYLDNTKNVIDRQAKELDSLNSRILKIKTDYGIVSEKDQSKYLSKQLSTGSSLNESAQLQLKGIKEKGTELTILEGRIKSNLKSYAAIKIKNDAYLLDAGENLDFYVYVSKPNLQDKKCSPTRWIIVLVSAISAFFMTLVFFLYKNRSKDLI